jgi:Family of unknown function (DUF6252)
MQKLFFSLLILSGFIFLQSCQKEINFSTGNPTSITGDFKAKINGTQWIANSASSASRFSGFISLTGRSTDKKYINITLLDSGVHNYILDDMSLNAASYIDSTLPNPVNFSTNQGFNPGDAGGSVKITSIDTANKKMSGIFSFKVFRQQDGLQRAMTEGSFTNLSYITSLPPSNSSDTFNVKIAGTRWTPPTVLGAKTPAVPPLTSQIVITGTDATGTKSVGIFMPANITPGTYTLDLFGGQYIGLYNPDADPNHSQSSTLGTLTIISHNTSIKRIRGTFSFHAEALLNPLLFTELTEGFFAVTYF